MGAIRSEFQLQAIGLNTQFAYVLATAERETGKTIQPISGAYFQSFA